MQFEKFLSKKFALLAIPVGALALAGCGPNYSGNGNEFVVQGKVTDPGKHSLKAEILEVDKASGQATHWFKINHIHQLHDNCDCHGWGHSNKRYGHVYDLQNYEISSSEVAIGACVRFEGKIKADSNGKTSEDRPVYDVAQVEDCNNIQRHQG